MAITAVAAFGAALKIGNGATSETFTEIEGVRNIDGPTRDMEIIDATHHATTGNYREKLASFLDPGQITFELLWDSTNTQHVALLTDHTDRTLRNFQLVYPDTGAETYAFSAFVRSLKDSAPIDNALTKTVTLELSGAISRTA